MSMDLKSKRVVVTGGAGFLGRVVCRRPRRARVSARSSSPGRQSTTSRTRRTVARMYATMRPQVVLHLAAEVGGIGANMGQSRPLLLREHGHGPAPDRAGADRRLEKFVQVGTICAYPNYTPVPFKEEDLWNGYPEETNAPYGIAKKAAMVMLDGYQRQYGLAGVYVLPVNLYGPHDNFDLETSHVIPALIRKCVEAMRPGRRPHRLLGHGRA